MLLSQGKPLYSVPEQLVQFPGEFPLLANLKFLFGPEVQLCFSLTEAFKGND